MKKYLIIAFMLATPAFASDWVYLGENNIGKDYLDKDSVRVKSFTGGGRYVSAWTRIDHKTAQKEAGGKTFWQAKFLRHYDCTNQKTNFSSLVFYDKQGNSVWSGTYPISFYNSQNWDDVVPETAGEAQFEMACQLAGL